MNLIDFGPLEQDNLVDYVYGKAQQLTVVGFSLLGTDRYKQYIVKCNICAEDPELFGEGFFSIYASNMKKGNMPCGCAAKHWSEAQQIVRVERQARIKGYKFVSWLGDFKTTKARTKLLMLCCEHGLWGSTELKSFVCVGHGCPSCAEIQRSITRTKPDHLRVEKILSSGHFTQGTTFKRLTDHSSNPLWEINCPDCKETYTRAECNLIKLGKACVCSGTVSSRQKYSYINLVQDGENAVAIKFGITGNPRKRISKMNNDSPLSVTNIFLFKYENSHDCIKAERVCKKDLETGVLSAFEMPDGWTETTHISNIDFILSTFKSCGGQRVDLCV